MTQRCTGTSAEALPQRKGLTRHGTPPEENPGKENLKGLIKALLEIGPVRGLIDLGKRSPAYRSLLNRALPGWLKFRGVFGSFEEAQTFVPAGARVGYDHREITGIYKGYADSILAGDYPVLLWLREVMTERSHVFDFGGNLGISFYGFAHYLDYPAEIDWSVCDVPAVVEAGKKMASERGESRLHFTTRFTDAVGCDILLASGCLMYVEMSLAQMLRTLRVLPRHLLINRCAIHEKRSCVTLQNIRWMISPYHVFERQVFIKELETLGYTLVDEWRDATHSCWIPFYPEHSVATYSGFYFRHGA